MFIVKVLKLQKLKDIYQIKILVNNQNTISTLNILKISHPVFFQKFLVYGSDKTSDIESYSG